MPPAQADAHAAHELRNWVRLTYACNNRCRFCLDAANHLAPRMRDREDIVRQILSGRAAGATRLILSGGEPTIHPQYLDFVRFGARAGYRLVQTVSNGRMFSYPGFLRRAVAAGLGELTVSIDGPDAALHDELVGVSGAFAQAMAGLTGALADGHLVVNADVVVNRKNVERLVEIVERLVAVGVREIDFLRAVPFGRAIGEGRDLLLSNAGEYREHLERALDLCARHGVQVWQSRFPAAALEGHPGMITHPSKLLDEVRGRREEFRRRIAAGVPLDCREPGRCGLCAVAGFCDGLEEEIARLNAGAHDVVRVNPAWEAELPADFGGDPASEEHARSGGVATVAALAPRPLAARLAGAARLHVVARDLAAAAAAVAALPGAAELELELADVTGVAATLGGRRVARVVVATPAAAEQVAALGLPVELVVAVNPATAEWLVTAAAPRRARLDAPASDEEAAAVDLRGFFARLPADVPVEDAPPCLAGPRARPPRLTLDAVILDAEGLIDPHRLARRRAATATVKSGRCPACPADARCPGLPVHYARVHGLGLLRPVEAADGCPGDVVARQAEDAPRLHLSIGPDCNNNCLFCMEEDRAARIANAAMTPERVREALLSHPGREEVCFTSGEPTLRPELPRFIAWARELGYGVVHLMTNGRRLAYPGYTAALVAAGLGRITVSIHGDTAALHDGLVRTPGAFAQTLAGVTVAAGLVETHTSTVVCRRNLPHLDEIYGLVRDRGVAQVVLNVPQVAGRALSHFDAVVARYSDIVTAVAAVVARRGPPPPPLYVVDLPLCTSERLPDVHRGFLEKRVQFLGHERVLQAHDDSQRREKRPACAGCRYDAVCTGVYRGYVERYGWDELVPVPEPTTGGNSSQP